MTGNLALTGARAVRTEPWPSWPQWDDAETKRLVEVLESGSWGGYSDAVDTFERDFAARHGARYCIATSNGTTSLIAALRAFGIGPGDEVVVPAYTFFATASAVRLVGATPVFVDIDAATYNLDIDALEAALGPRCRAVIPVHFAGQSVDFDKLEPVAHRHSLHVIEDAAHAHGSTWRGCPVGAIGEIGSFSFQSNKNMTAGEGGAVVTNDEALAERLWSEIHHGRERNGDWYRHPQLGSNLRITGWQAAVLNAQLERLDEQIEHRQRSARSLRALLVESGVRPLDWDERADVHAHHLFVLRYHADAFGNVDRRTFVEALRAEGIPCSTGYPAPLYDQPPLAPAHGRVTPCPVAVQACREAIWLSHPLLLASPDDIADIPTAIARIRRNATELSRTAND